MPEADAEAALAAADILSGFESYQLLTGDQDLDLTAARSVLVTTLTVLLTPGTGR